MAYQEQARLWTQDWRTRLGTHKYTLHVNHDDIPKYQAAYNATKAGILQIIPIGIPRQIIRPRILVQQIHDHGLGMQVDRRPQ